MGVTANEPFSPGPSISVIFPVFCFPSKVVYMFIYVHQQLSYVPVTVKMSNFLYMTIYIYINIEFSCIMAPNDIYTICILYEFSVCI